MNWTTFWLIMGPILATLVSIAGSVFLKEWWVERFWRPILYIRNENILPQPIGGVIWHRIIVYNDGKSAAENCAGSITLDITANDIWEKPSSFTVNIQEPQPILTKQTFCEEEMVLCWSRIGNPESRTINRKSPAALDVFRVKKDQDGLRIELPTENGWSLNIRIALKADKEYSGKLRITSGNADPAETNIKLTPQNGDDIKLDIVKQSA